MIPCGDRTTIGESGPMSTGVRRVRPIPGSVLAVELGLLEDLPMTISLTGAQWPARLAP